ncbi:MAG: DUF4280 domain-containing protein [Oscillospiraceae bacterium]|nr:DUF4280 domain-containing protein [Oscillospiraceae bacterium]
MGLSVAAGAQLSCSFGTAPGAMAVLPAKRVMATMPAATVMDNIPMTNIMPFAMCVSLSNPAVAAATAAALGVLTPQPCVPATSAPWAPGSISCMIGGVPALESNSRLLCNWGGVIQVISPGQTKTVIAK